MRLRGKLAILAMATAVSAAYAQLPLNPDAAAQIGQLNRLGGKATIDVITLRENMVGIPLRFPAVIAGSESVQFNGKTLTRGADYQIDADSGVVYLMKVSKPGDVLRVGYRYDEAKVAQRKMTSQFAGMAPFKFDLAPGALSMVMGFGMTERAADGNVTQSNVYGVNNRLSFGSANLKGLMLMGNRQKVQQESDFEYRGQAGQTETGKSHFMLQNLAVAMGGGAVEVNFQDISQNFTGFSAAQDGGYTAQQIAQLQKERGLKRFSLGMRDVGLGGLKVSGGTKSVGDGDSEIEWQSFGLRSGGAQIEWKSQQVGQAFSRFNDLGEADREQLKKEAGMSRESLSASFGSKAGKLSLNMSQVSDPQNAKIDRREVGFDAKEFKFWYGDQEVGQDFRRMQSLKGEEQALYGRELGMQRQWFGMQANLFGAGAPIKFSQNILGSDAGEYSALDASLQGKGWSLSHTSRNASQGFTNFGAMQDGERNENINAIGRMYDPGGIPFRGEEVQWLQRSNGISRSLTRIAGDLLKDWKLVADRLELKGVNDTASLDTFRLEGKKLRIDYRSQNLGEDFDELTRLLELERNRLGVISGLQRTDFTVASQLSPNRSFLYSSMKANSPQGGASRSVLNYSDPKLQIAMTNREVDPGFTNVNQLVDPDKEFFAAMRGFSERDVKASWQINPNLKFDMFLLDSASHSLDQTRYVHSYELNWKPDKSTQLMAKRLEQRNDDPLRVLFANTTNFLSLNRDFGALGKLSFLKETKDYEGLDANLPDSDKTYVGYEAKLNSKTSVKAEQTTTTFGDGGKENVSTKTVSTELGKHMGVSVSDVRIDRDGDDRDEKKQGYGIWFDIANGIRLVYGMAQHNAGVQGVDTRNQNTTISGGTLGNVQVGNGAYTVNQWDDTRTQAMGNLSLATVKPMSFLGFTGLKISASLDTASDRAVWLKENKLFSISGKLGSYGLGFDYRSQIAPNGVRGIDRTFSFTTDQDEKKPIRASFKYKHRTLPTGQELAIRDYSVVAKPFKNFELTHQLLTNPEVARGDVILGSITQARQENRWKLDYKRSSNFTFGGEWREFSDQNQPMTRLGGLTMTLNQGKGSPVSLFYGIEESDAGGSRKRQDRYHIRFDQRPGPHQQFSFFIGNVSYLRGISPDQNRNNLTVQLDFQIRF